MKKTLVLLLTSSALLGACGTADEPEAAEEVANEPETVEEQKSEIAEGQTEEQIEETTEETTEETAEVVDDNDSYFSGHYNQNLTEIENKLEDASELSGLYSVELPADKYAMYENEPQKTFIDIKEDGRATVLTYQLAEPMIKDIMTDEPIYMYPYLDEQNNLVYANKPTPNMVVLASGYMVQKFGETQIEIVESGVIYPYLDEKGEIALSSLLNPVSKFIRTELPRRYSSLKEPAEVSLGDTTLTKTNGDDIDLPFMLNNGSLLSVAHVDRLLVEDENERIKKKAESDAYEEDPFAPYVENNNEFLYYLIENNGFQSSTVQIADNPSEYNGFTENNIEITPEVVFISGNGNIAKTYHEDGTIWNYRFDDGTWH